MTEPASERAQRYAEAINETGVIHCTDGTPQMGCDGCQVERDEVVTAVMAVADAELGELRAEVERLRRFPMRVDGGFRARAEAAEAAEAKAFAAGYIEGVAWDGWTPTDEEAAAAAQAWIEARR